MEPLRTHISARPPSDVDEALDSRNRLKWGVFEHTSTRPISGAFRRAWAPAFAGVTVVGFLQYVTSGGRGWLLIYYF